MAELPEDWELPLDVEEFLTWLTAERGRSANTLAAYRRDLTAYCHWLSET
ncbi:MAG: site-specific tyrosine recombinase XerD, partial [Actinobacteria bacterium]|nr:site-specific tyrosine recombinase XerD [Actinomycetota bacterium]